MKRVNVFLLGLIGVLLSACGGGSAFSSGTENTGGNGNLYDIRLRLRDNHFLPIEGATLLLNGKAVEASYSEGVYSYLHTGENPTLSFTKEGYVFNAGLSLSPGGIDYVARTNEKAYDLCSYFVGVKEADKALLDHLVSFHGIFDDQALHGDAGLSGATMAIEGHLVYTTDSTGNFDLFSLFAGTKLTFSHPSYTLQYSDYTLSEEPEQFLRIHGFPPEEAISNGRHA